MTTDPLPALAAQVARLSEELGALRSQQQAQATVLGEVGELRRAVAAVDGLPDAVAELSSTLTAALGEDEALVVTAPYFSDMDEATYQAAIDKLGEWVTSWLAPNFGGYLAGKVQPCWRSHMEAVNELALLHAEWRRVYERSQPSLKGALDLVNRWMPGAFQRLGPVMRSCSGGCILVRKLKAQGE